MTDYITLSTLTFILTCKLDELSANIKKVLELKAHAITEIRRI